MDSILWILIVAAVLIALVGLFALARSRQRRGEIFASQPTQRPGGTQ